MGIDTRRENVTSGTVWESKVGNGERISCGTFTVQSDGSATVSMSAPVSSVSYPGSSGDVVLKGSPSNL